MPCAFKCLVTLTPQEPSEELKKQLPLLRKLENVTLEGTLPATAELVELKETFPNITFLWEFSVCGVKTNTLAEFIDLSKRKMSDTKELEAAKKFLASIEGKLSNEKFISRAPEAVVNAEREKAAKHRDLITQLEQSLAAMQKLATE